LRRGRLGSEAQSPTIKLIEATNAARPERIITQAELNKSSYEEYEAVELAMQQALRRLEPCLDGESLTELKASQSAWKDFRVKQVSFAGGFYRGGSIVPLICNSEAAALTSVRAQELKAIHEELQSR
jgi:uncharacterized protein YecT (DUF1311 family)